MEELLSLDVATKELETHPEIIGVATTTFYKGWQPGDVDDPSEDKLRGDLAIQFAQTVIENGHQFVVIDGGSSDAFKEKLHDLGVSVYQQSEPGMSGSRRQAFKEVNKLAGVKVIVWSEPEKVSFVSHDCFIPAVLPVLQGLYDVVIPHRTEDSFATYPGFQVDSEKKFNKRWTNLLRIAGLWKNEEDLDVAFGPRVFRNTPEMLELFFATYTFGDTSQIRRYVNPEKYSNATFFPVAAALFKKLRVGTVAVDYRHPPKQRELEELRRDEYLEKRVSQYNDIVIGLKHFLHYQLEMPKKSKISLSTVFL